MRPASAPAYRVPVEAKRQAVALLQQHESGQGVHLKDPLLTGTVHFIAFESGWQAGLLRDARHGGTDAGDLGRGGVIMLY